MSNKETNTEMKNLTKEQSELFTTLLRLGDSKEIALKTVLDQKEKDTSMYYSAYCL